MVYGLEMQDQLCQILAFYLLDFIWGAGRVDGAKGPHLPRWSRTIIIPEFRPRHVLPPNFLRTSIYAHIPVSKKSIFPIRATFGPLSRKRYPSKCRILVLCSAWLSSDIWLTSRGLHERTSTWNQGDDSYKLKKLSHVMSDAFGKLEAGANCSPFVFLAVQCRRSIICSQDRRNWHAARWRLDSPRGIISV